MLVESLEVGGIANKDTLVFSQVSFQFRSTAFLQAAEEEVGAGLLDRKAGKRTERSLQACGLLKKRGQVDGGRFGMRSQEKPRLNGQRTDRPGTAHGADLCDQRLRRHQITEPQAGNGVALGHRVDLDDVRVADRLCFRQQRLACEEAVGLVYHEDGLGIIRDSVYEFIFGNNRSRGIIRITKPQYFRTAVRVRRQFIRQGGTLPEGLVRPAGRMTGATERPD